ncbi:MAG: hypothetical protein AAB662_04180 [Patescibacteria group bacterium]
MYLNDFINAIHSWVVSLHPNEVALLSTSIGAIITLIAAYIAVRTAFKQIARQFEHKIVYEGWQDLQQKLFDFSNALTDYDSVVQWLTYFVTSQDNLLVNGGNKAKHRQEKWQQLIDTYSNLQKAYIAFLRSFENHEVILLPLSKMKKAFIEEYRKRIDDRNQKFMELLFPEMYGQSNNPSPDDAKKEINDYWYQMSEISAFLDDCRVELQNVTVGKVLHKKVPRREPPDKKYKILTTDGFLTEKPTFKELVKKLLKVKGLV